MAKNATRTKCPRVLHIKNIYKLINLNEQSFKTCPDAAINPK